jgi:hypothetical protein
MDNVLSDTVFERVLVDVRALQRNDLRCLHTR